MFSFKIPEFFELNLIRFVSCISEAALAHVPSVRATQAGPEDSSSGTNSFPLGAAAAASAASPAAAPPAPEEERPAAAPPPPPPPPPPGDLLPPDDSDELPRAVGDDDDPLDFDLDQDLTLPLKVKENLKALVEDFPRGLPVMKIAR